ncbi:hypothetical protein [Desulfatiglans anilini]|nr:hypothetical protein [Desulfatiglans anilini]
MPSANRIEPDTHHTVYISGTPLAMTSENPYNADAGTQAPVCRFRNESG